MFVLRASQWHRAPRRQAGQHPAAARRHVKIMDFGVARLTRDDASRVTRQGDLIGTLLYLSPEQVMGSDVDALCDIFAYGVTYYELLTYQHPFQARDPRAVMYRITSQDPEPIRSVTPDCPMRWSWYASRFANATGNCVTRVSRMCSAIPSSS